MLDKLKFAYAWIVRNFKLVLSVFGSTVLFVFLASWYSKNKKIRSLENELAIIRTQLELDRLAYEYKTTIGELGKLKREDADLQLELNKIEKELKIKLDSDMTAEEIVEKFKEIGLQ